MTTPRWLKATRRELSESDRSEAERQRYLAERKHARFAWLRRLLWLHAHGYKVRLPPWARRFTQR